MGPSSLWPHTPHNAVQRPPATTPSPILAPSKHAQQRNQPPTRPSFRSSLHQPCHPPTAKTTITPPCLTCSVHAPTPLPPHRCNSTSVHRWGTCGLSVNPWPEHSRDKKSCFNGCFLSRSSCGPSGAFFDLRKVMCSGSRSPGATVLSDVCTRPSGIGSVLIAAGGCCIGVECEVQTSASPQKNPSTPLVFSSAK